MEIPLGSLKPGESGTIKSFTGQENNIHRLQELGLLQGVSIQVSFEAPFGRDPMAVRVRGGLIALRRKEADQILVVKI